MLEKFLLGKKLPHYSDQAYIPATTLPKTKLIVKKNDNTDKILQFLFSEGEIELNDLKDAKRILRCPMWLELIKRHNFKEPKEISKTNEPTPDHHEQDQFAMIQILNLCRNVYEGHENDLFYVYERVKNSISDEKTVNKDSEEKSEKKDLEGKSDKKDSEEKSDKKDSQKSTVNEDSIEENVNKDPKKSSSNKDSEKSNLNGDSEKSTPNKDQVKDDMSNSASSVQEKIKSLENKEITNSINNPITKAEKLLDKPINTSNIILEKNVLKNLLLIILFLHKNVTNDKFHLVKIIKFLQTLGLSKHLEQDDSRNQVEQTTFLLKLKTFPFSFITILDTIIFHNLKISNLISMIMIKRPNADFSFFKHYCDEFLYTVQIHTTENENRKEHPENDKNQNIENNVLEQQITDDYFNFLILEEQMIQAQQHIKQTLLDEIEELKKTNGKLTEQIEEFERNKNQEKR